MMEQIVRERPRTRVLYMSGYTVHPALKGGPFRSSDAFIPKPFTMAEMELAVRRALEGRRRSSEQPSSVRT